MVHALVASRLDYCNVLYMELPLKSAWKLLLVQNAVARILAREGCSRSHSLVLYHLFWLPIQDVVFDI